MRQLLLVITETALRGSCSVSSQRLHYEAAAPCHHRDCITRQLLLVIQNLKLKKAVNKRMATPTKAALEGIHTLYKYEQIGHLKCVMHKRWAYM